MIPRAPTPLFANGAPLKRLGAVAKFLAQATALCLLAWGTHSLAQMFQLPIPGSVVGLALLLLCLWLKLVPEQALALAATWMVGDLMLFFIPPVISVLNYTELLQQFGAQLVLALLVGSVTMIVGTGLVVDRLFRFEHRLNQRRGINVSLLQEER